MIVNSSRGGGSKDTWVLEDGGDEPTSPPSSRCPSRPPALPDLRYGGWPGQAQQQQQQQPPPALMLARIAHELFWLGRNLARAEHTARDVDGVFQAELQGRPRRRARASRSAGARCWRSWAPARRAAPRAGATTCCSALTLDADNPASMRRLRRARARGRAHRARRDLAPRCGRRSTRPHLRCASDDLERRLRDRARTRSTSTSRSACALFWGLDDRTMLRDEAQRVPRRRRAHRVGRHGAADAARRVPAAATSATAARRPGARAAAGGRRLPGLPARGARRRPTPAPVARFLLFERAYPDCVAASRRRAARRARARPTRARATPSRCCASAGWPPTSSSSAARCRTTPAIWRDLRARPAGARARRPRHRRALLRRAPLAAASARSPSTPMNFAIRYLTEYRYEAPVTDNLNALRVRPATTSTQRCDEFHVRSTPRRASAATSTTSAPRCSSSAIADARTTT